MAEGSEQFTDPLIGSVVMSGVDGVEPGEVIGALYGQHPEVAQLMQWSNRLNRQGGLFERDRFVSPRGIFDQMRVAADAAEHDDVVAGVLESTESLAFTRIGMEAEDEDEEDIWEQIIEDLDLETRLREMWRELFTVSNFYVAVWWGTKSYKVRGTTKSGVKRKKEFKNLKVPIAMSLLDPLKVIPVGSFLFNQEQLAYVADRNEAKAIRDTIGNRIDATDQIISRLITGEYKPTEQERKELAENGIPVDNLFLLDPSAVWRHTATRPQYKRWAEVRLSSIFDLLDQKNQLREMDRAVVVGASNYIIVVKKGLKDEPATQPEIENLKSQMRVMARLPVLVGDHRLTIEIITPDISQTLNREKWDVLDNRIVARLFQMFLSGGNAGSSKDDSMKMVRVVAAGLESRRTLIANALKRRVFERAYRENEEFESCPKLAFYPHRIALDFDGGLAAFYRDLRDRRIISRATVLEQVDLEESAEARKIEREHEKYDDTFNELSGLPDQEKITDEQIRLAKANGDEQIRVAKENSKLAPKIDPMAQKPGGPADTKKKPAQDPKAAGRTQGGNKGGGGAAPGTGQGKPADRRQTPKGSD